MLSTDESPGRLGPAISTDVLPNSLRKDGVRFCRAGYVGGPRGGRMGCSPVGMMTFTELPPIRSDSVVPFGEQLATGLERISGLPY